MTRNRWKQIEGMLGQVLDLDPAARAAHLGAACGADAELRREVESLLEEEARATGILSAAVGAAAGSLTPLGPSIRTGQRVGAYRILSEIGRGGMGAVYLADRDDDEFSKKVAIKIVQHGMVSDYTLTRFRHERQILASLEHSNIARMLDGGTTEDGVPYVVMEYIGGRQIVDYCVEQGLAVEARLRLFQTVCSAVQYAHKNLIVHRDLKPANILVTPEGVPKLLDFGLAKLIETDPNGQHEALTGVFRMMTPEYAGPEQVLGRPITTLSDVYSLGAVLYEMLTGARAHKLDDYSPAELQRAICEVEPRRPSEIEDGITADLDNIVLKALQKEPERRYSSAEQFSADIGRYLDGRPILARQDTLVYRATKFVRRNKLAVAAIVTIVASLAGGAAVSAHQARRAERRFQQVRKLATSFLFDFHTAIREIPGTTKARQLVVKTGLDYLDTLAAEARGDAALQRELAEAYMLIGNAQGGIDASLGDTSGALASYRKALAIIEEVLRDHPRDAAAGLLFVRVSARLGDAQSQTGEIEGALAHYERATAVGERLTALEPQNRHHQQALAYILKARSDQALDTDQSIPLIARAVAMLEEIARTAAADDPVWLQLTAAYSTEGRALTRANRLQEAAGRFNKNLQILKRLLENNPNHVTSLRNLMLTHGNLGDLLGSPTQPNLGNSKGAREQYREMLRIAEQIHRSDPANGRALTDYGIAQVRVANLMVDESPAEAAGLFLQALNKLEQQAASDPRNSRTLVNIAFAYQRVADSLVKTGDESGALRNYLRGIEIGKALEAKDAKDWIAKLTLVDLHRSILPVFARKRQVYAVEHHCSQGIKLASELEMLDPKSFRLLVNKPRVQARCGGAYASLQQWERSAEYYQASKSGWREISKRSEFDKKHRLEMEQVDAEAERARRRARKR